MEARDARRLQRLQKQMATHKLLIIDELGFVPLGKTGAELLFALISQRYARGVTLITSNMPFFMSKTCNLPFVMSKTCNLPFVVSKTCYLHGEWTKTFGSKRLTGALLDRLTHHVNILEMNSESYRLGQSKARQDKA